MNHYFRLSNVLSAEGGSVNYPPGGRFGPRVQQDYQLVLLHTGQMTVYIDDVPHHVQPGHAVLLKPGHVEQFYFAKQQETWHRWIAVHFKVDPDALSESTNDSPLTLPISEDLNRMTDLMISLRSRHKNDSEVVRSLGIAAIQYFRSETMQIQPNRKHPSVDLAKSFIADRFHDDLTLDLIAESASLSPEHLVRLFRNYEKITPIKYLWQYRILKANELLIQTGLPMGEVAIRCGFKTSYHFARMFKQLTGVTPSAFRQNNWRGQ
ncbi:helix-turn-helix domain-containing protein [Cohnella soli]|uniref:Helix-turn-helix domain-containing protein n=1 Tax=Cohnella soli TaxID=425005 RepID=A0ABW0HSK8_9BACL